MKVILKADDFRSSRNWERFINYLDKYGIKTSIGIIGGGYDVGSVLKLYKNGHELFNHGFSHAKNEFKRSYDLQKKSLIHTQSKLRSNGIVLQTFGAPCNDFNETTIKVVNDVEDIKVWLFGISDIYCLLYNREFKNKYSKKLVLENKIVPLIPHSHNILEHPTHNPDYDWFIKRMEELNDEEYLLIQLHPLSWNDKRFDIFKRSIDYMLNKNCEFLTPMEYYKFKEV